MIGQTFIAGRWIDGERVETRNPSDLDEVVGEYVQSDVAQVEEALEAARDALPGWRAFNIQARSDLLRHVGDKIFARREEIGKLLAREEGKTLPEAVGEAIRAAQVFHYFSGESLRHMGHFGPGLRDGFNVIVSYEPVGIVSLITPWNFPVAIAAWKTAAALAFGNCCVLKPSEFAPGCAVILTRILEEAGLPSGVFNLVMGDGRVLGDALIDGADAVSFTGSSRTGQAIAVRAAKSMTKLQLELGGKNPLLVLDDADLDLAVDAALQGTFGQTGQRCTGSSRLIVQAGIHDPFVERLARAAGSLRIGHALDPATQVGPVANQPQYLKNLSYIDIANAAGAELVTGGGPADAEKLGLYMSPTLFIGTHNDMQLNQEEVFGPVAGVIKVADLDEAIAVATSASYALSSGICTTNQLAIERFRRASTAGLVMVNAATAGIDYHVPFGGRPPSGFGGCEMGWASADFFSESKTTYVNHGIK
jgi:acyl-CoA reductase-like NAD-dependent aldehyde dehydrogenase